jgi:hypothetical protein
MLLFVHDSASRGIPIRAATVALKVADHFDLREMRQAAALV